MSGNGVRKATDCRNIEYVLSGTSITVVSYRIEKTLHKITVFGTVDIWLERWAINAQNKGSSLL